MFPHTPPFLHPSLCRQQAGFNVSSEQQHLHRQPPGPQQQQQAPTGGADFPGGPAHALHAKQTQAVAEHMRQANQLQHGPTPAISSSDQWGGTGNAIPGGPSSTSYSSGSLPHGGADQRGGVGMSATGNKGTPPPSLHQQQQQQQRRVGGSPVAGGGRGGGGRQAPAMAGRGAAAGVAVLRAEEAAEEADDKTKAGRFQPKRTVTNQVSMSSPLLCCAVQ